MTRQPRVSVGGMVYHVLNRSNGRVQIFRESSDYLAFEKVMSEAQQRTPIRILSYCIMPNHWHLVLWPYSDGDLSSYLHWLTLTHTQRFHAFRQSAGSGHLYQGRFKSFPVQTDDHFLAVCRYVERNPLRAGLVRTAQSWRWSSLWRREHGHENDPDITLSAWPVDRPDQWPQRVNEPQPQSELEDLRLCANRGRPYGRQEWSRNMAAKLGLESTLRPRGRPRKAAAASSR